VQSLRHCIAAKPRLVSFIHPSAFTSGRGRLAARPPEKYDVCKDAVRAELRFGIASKKTPTVLAPDIDPDETLAEAVCCDSRVFDWNMQPGNMHKNAEPYNLSFMPEIDLFGHLGESGGTFYDSVCLLPLFKVPVGRSLEDFKQETAANGFPTFREEEVVDAANLQAKPVGTTGTKLLTTATCGAHRGVTQLGRYEESQNGAPRYIVDLSCVAGVGKQR